MPEMRVSITVEVGAETRRFIEEVLRLPELKAALKDLRGTTNTLEDAVDEANRPPRA